MDKGLALVLRRQQASHLEREPVEWRPRGMGSCQVQESRGNIYVRSGVQLRGVRRDARAGHVEGQARVVLIGLRLAKNEAVLAEVVA